MGMLVVFFLLANPKVIFSEEISAFNVKLRLTNAEHHFRFVQVARPIESHRWPSMVVLDHHVHPTIRHSPPSSSVRTYRLQANGSLSSRATSFVSASSHVQLLYVTVQISNGLFYDIVPIVSALKSRSFIDDYTVRHDGLPVARASVSIQWRRHSEARAIAKASTSSRTSHTRKPRHLHLELVAAVDSLIFNDLRHSLNRPNSDIAELLQLYYIHTFIGVEQLYRQSFVQDKLQIHIHLSTIILATEKFPLPWELFKNVSSRSNSYRQSPNAMRLRPNISMKLLQTLHRAYASNQFHTRFFPKSADHIVTFTRMNLIDSAGCTFIAGICSPSHRYSIVQEDFNAHATTLTVAHELGHNLGLNDDENHCRDAKVRYIMSPKRSTVDTRRPVPYFSRCSISQLHRFVDHTKATCWHEKLIGNRNDSKPEKKRSVTSTKFGQIISLRRQCQLLFGMKALPSISVASNRSRSLYDETVCQQLRCLNSLDDPLLLWHDGALDGQLTS